MPPCDPIPPALPQAQSEALWELQELLHKHTGPEVLRAAARALGAFCDPQLPLWGRADLVRSRLVDQLSRRWQRHMSRIVGVLRGGGCGVVGLWGI